MAIPTINALPEAPLPSDSPEVFNSKAFAFVDALSEMTTQMNAAISAINAIYSQDVVFYDGISLSLLSSQEGLIINMTYEGAKTLTLNVISVGLFSEFAIFHIINGASSGNVTINHSGFDVYPPAGGTNVIPPGGMISIKRLSPTEFKVIGQVVAA